MVASLASSDLAVPGDSPLVSVLFAAHFGGSPVVVVVGVTL